MLEIHLPSRHYRHIRHIPSHITRVHHHRPSTQPCPNQPLSPPTLLRPPRNKKTSTAEPPISPAANPTQTTSNAVNKSSKTSLPSPPINVHRSYRTTMAEAVLASCTPLVCVIYDKTIKMPIFPIYHRYRHAIYPIGDSSQTWPCSVKCPEGKRSGWRMP